MAKHRRRVEYLTDIQNDLMEVESELNRRAQEGWTLHTMVFVHDNLVMTFERSFIEPEPEAK